MTGTIKPFADVSYKDPKTRYMEYQKNIHGIDYDVKMMF